MFENVAFPLRKHTDLPEVTIRDLVLLKLNSVGLRGARDLLPSQLSGGMARRVALARAIALDPSLLVYDEPFTGQDPIALGVVQSLIKKLNTALCATSLLVSHDIHETVSIADKIYVIADNECFLREELQRLWGDDEDRDWRGWNVGLRRAGRAVESLEPAGAEGSCG